MVGTSEEIIKKYSLGKSMSSLGREYHISPYMIKKILVQNNIKIRSRNEQNKFSPQNQRKFTINDNYFSIQNNNMAYLLGFLATDGCVYQNQNLIKLALSSVDKSFLEKVNMELSSTFPIHDYTTNKGFLVSEVRWTSSQIKTDLSDYNIVPNKTYSFVFPQKLEEQYYIDFIRGYFDGDGCVSTAGKALRWQICAYKPEVLQTIIDILFKYGIPRVNIMKNRNVFYFQYSTDSTKKIYDILYPSNCLYLDRKKEKYEKLLMK